MKNAIQINVVINNKTGVSVIHFHLVDTFISSSIWSFSKYCYRTIFKHIFYFNAEYWDTELYSRDCDQRTLIHDWHRFIKYLTIEKEMYWKCFFTHFIFSRLNAQSFLSMEGRKQTNGITP